LPATFDPALANAASRHLRRERLELAPRKQWPRGLLDRRGRIGDDERVEPGRVLCRWGRAGWGPLVEQGKLRDGRFDDRLVRASVELITGQWEPTPELTWVTWVPSHRYPTLVADFAQRLATALGLPAHDALAVRGHPPSQRTRNNSIQQAANVLDAFEVRGAVPSEPVLLVDDLVHSQWTLTVTGMLLREAAVPAVHPFVLATSQVG
jgi:ATP-dependent DNA helicase RecQ